MKQLSVVVPTFNESANVGRLIEALQSTLQDLDYEVIFVDDDSPDGTFDRVRAFARHDPKIRILRRIGRDGLASACVEGMMAASAPYIAVMDGDLQHDERILPEMLRKLQDEDLDIVVGSRNIAGGDMGSFAKERVALSNWGRSISQMVCRSGVSDPMSGFFVLDRRFLDEVLYDISAIGFKILVDLLASSRRPVRLGEVAYSFRNREAGESKLDVLVLVEYVQLIADKFTNSLVPARFLLFSAVGALGVLVHMFCLALLYRFGNWEFLSSYAVATLLAMTSNFFLNNLITYRDCRLKGPVALATGWLSFCIACSLGALVSFQVAEALRLSGIHWIPASLTGILFASVWNYAITQLLTWRRRRQNRRHRSEARQKAARLLRSSDAN